MTINQEAVEKLRTRAQREIDSGLLPGCQLAIARHGEVELFEAFGDANTDSRFVIFSATKAFVASAVWILIGEGTIDITLPVTEYIPEFGTLGKDQITVEQVMLHTSGFPHAPLGSPDWWTREGRVEAVRRVAPELGARQHLRVPRDLRALGARRDHRPGDRR